MPWTFFCHYHQISWSSSPSPFFDWFLERNSFPEPGEPNDTPCFTTLDMADSLLNRTLQACGSPASPISYMSNFSTGDAASHFNHSIDEESIHFKYSEVLQTLFARPLVQRPFWMLHVDHPWSRGGPSQVADALQPLWNVQPGWCELFLLDAWLSFHPSFTLLGFWDVSVGNPQWTIWSQHGDDISIFVQNH